MNDMNDMNDMNEYSIRKIDKKNAGKVSATHVLIHTLPTYILRQG